MSTDENINEVFSCSYFCFNMTTLMFTVKWENEFNFDTFSLKSLTFKRILSSLSLRKCFSYPGFKDITLFFIIQNHNSVTESFITGERSQTDLHRSFNCRTTSWEKRLFMVSAEHRRGNCRKPHDSWILAAQSAYCRSVCVCVGSLWQQIY